MAEEIGSILVNIGLKADAFQAGINNLKREMKVVESNFKATGASIDGFGNKLDGLKAKSDALTQKMDIQRKMVDTHRQALQASIDKLQKHGQATTELKNKLDQTKSAYDASAIATGKNSAATKALGAEVKKLEQEYKQKVQTLQNDNAAIDRNKIKMNEAEAGLKSMQQELKNTAKEIDKKSSAWSQMGDKLKKTGDKMKSMGHDIAMPFTIASAAIGGALGLAVKKSMDFEQAMANAKSVMSPDEVDKFAGSLQNLAIKMGAETKYSATEAANGITELVKAGVKVTDIINGGLDGALSLATAGDIELADAATIASTALNAFRDDALSVSQAADILAGAANASATDVGELKFGLSAVSAVASGVGLSFKDTATGLAAFAQNGLKGSDAGTSLKTMLLNLQPSTKKQIEEFERLNLMTYDTQKGLQVLRDNGIKPTSSSFESVDKALHKFAATQAGVKEGSAKAQNEYLKLAMQTGVLTSKFYDAHGSLKSMSEIAGTFHEALSGMTDAQRQASLETMLGTDAIRAGNILYKEGAQGITDMAAAMDKVKAADVAAAKMQTLKGSIEQLRGSFETAQISIGNALVPAINMLTQKLQGAVDWFNKLSPNMQSFIAISGAVVFGVTAAIAAFGILSIGVGALAEAFAVLFSPVGLVLAAIAAGGVIIYEMYKHFDDAKKALGDFNATLLYTLNPFGAVVLAIKGVQEAFRPLISTTIDYGNKVSESTAKAMGEYDKLNTGVTEKLDQLKWSGAKLTKEMGDEIVKNFAEMGTKVKEALDKSQKDALDAAQKLFQKTKVITKSEQQQAIEDIKNEYENKKKAIDAGQKEIARIKEKSVKESRALTQSEQEYINKIQATMYKFETDAVAKNAEEQRILLERQKAQHGEISAAQAADVVQNSNKQKDGTVKAAKEQYDKNVATIIKLRDETKSITEQQAEQMIKEQNMMKNDAIKNAEDMHTKVVAEAKKQAQDHVGEVNWETGQILKGWDKFVGKFLGAINWVLEGIGSGKIAAPQAYANGTDFHPGGIALVGEEGREMAHIPGMGTTMLGENGPQLLNLPRGSSVLPNKETEDLLKKRVPGYANGVGDFFSWITQGSKNIMENLLTKFNVKLPDMNGNILKNLGTDSFKFLKDKVSGWIKEKVDSFLSAFGGVGGDVGGSFKGGAVSGNVAGWIRQAMALTGAPESWFSALSTIAMHESSGNPHLVNNWDSNAKKGIPSKGLMQTIGPTFTSNMVPGHGDIWNPVDNAAAAIRYIMKRYGNPFNTPGIKSMSKGGPYKGYASGTKAPTKHEEWVWIGENGPELVKLPAGSEVKTHKDSLKIASGKGDTKAKTVKQQASTAKKILAEKTKAQEKDFDSAMKTVEYNFKMGKIDLSGYIQSLKEVQAHKAKTAEQVRKVNLEIKKSEDDLAKKVLDKNKETFDFSKKYIDERKYYNQLSLSEELAAWQRVSARYKEGTEQRKEADKEVYRVKQELEKASFDASKAYIEEEKYYNRMSTEEELAAWQRVQARYKEGTEQRKEANREVYRLEKEINDARIQNEQKIYDLKKKITEDLTAAQEDYANKVRAANDKLAQDERNLTAQFEQELKNRADAISNFVGLFDAIQPQEVSGTVLLDNLQGQVTAFEDWQKSMAELSGKGIDQALIEQLRNMGPQAGAQIAALNTLTSEQLDQYVSLWREKNQMARSEADVQLEAQRAEMYTKLSEIRSQAAEQLTQYADEWRKKNEEITKNTTDELKKIVEESAKYGEQMVTRMALAITTALPQLAGAFQGTPIFDILLGNMGDGSAVVDGAKKQADGVIGETTRQKTGVVDNTAQMINNVNQMWVQATQQNVVQQQQIQTQTVTMWQGTQQTLTLIWQKIQTDLQKTWTDNKKFLFEVLKQVEIRFVGLVTTANEWGVGMMDNFISGVRSKYSDLIDMMIEMTTMVDSYMPHSPAKVGPLSKLNEWGPGMMGAFIDGIQKNIPGLESMINEVSSIAAQALPTGEFGSSGSSRSQAAVYNYGGNTINFTMPAGTPKENADYVLRELYRLGVISRR